MIPTDSRHRRRQSPPEPVGGSLRRRRATGDHAKLAVHEAEIDQIVYRLFDLTPDEIGLIESALAPTRTTKSARKRAAV